MPTTSDPSSMNDPSAVPSIRLFQFDSSTIGALASAVNLFRGDVNLTQNLFTFPGRQPGTGLDLDVTVMYQSNVARDAATWNLDAPTGVLGLGWSLPLTSIQATSSGSPDPDTWSYVLYDNGSPTELVRQPQSTLLFTLPAATLDGLQPGATIPSDLSAAFGATGFLVDADASLAEDSGIWTIVDASNQQTFTVAASATDPTVCAVTYGGLEFQLHAYQPWQIVYFPAFERWLVVTDDGIRKSFGGIAADVAPGVRTSIGNSVVWDVWWGSEGVPLWSGPSTNATGQMQIASAWYLASTSNCFGDSVDYEYNGWARGADGLLPDVEQTVGAAGLPYTKATYLTRVTDTFGRTATFVYADKVWSDSGPCEYADPHRPTPSTAPNAYQDCYETKYLASVELAAASGAPLYEIQFTYAPDASATGPTSALANVTSYTGYLYDNTFKRYLTGITVADSKGNTLPGYVYDYWLDATAVGSQPGALRSVTAPQGGSVSYAYTAQELAVCQRTQTIDRPTQAPNGVPRVFYGDDYVVTLWYDAANSVVTMQVDTWVGRWITWQLDASTPLIYQGPFVPTSLDVLANTEFFVVTLDTGESSVAWVFSKDSARPGQFLPATVGGTTTAVSVPTLTFPSGTVSYVGGDTFVAVGEMDTVSATWSCTVLTWRWSTQAWELDTTSPEYYTWLAAQGEYLLAVDWSGNVSLSYLDGELTWHTAPVVTIPGFAVPGGNPDYVLLATGASMAAVNLVVSSTASVSEYQLAVLQWDAGHTLQLPYQPAPILESHGLGTTPNWAPEIVDDTLLALNGYLMRFDGAQWLTNTNLMVQSPAPGSTQRYAYGPDYALQVVADGNGLGTTAAVLGFDPDSVTADWTTSPAQPPLPEASMSYDNWPSAGDADYAVLGPNLYYRGTATDWTVVAGSSTPTDISSLVTVGGFDSESLVNEGPAFLSFSVRPQGDPTLTTAQSIVLQNGEVVPGSPTTFAAQRMYTPSLEGPAGPGESPQGPWVFVTYTSDTGFDEATAIALNQFAGDAVSGPISHYAVTSVCIDDAYQEPATTTYGPDPTQAACDPTGLIVKYYATTVYPGTDDPDAAPFGWTQSNYINGVSYSGTDYFDMLDGLLAATAIYDASGSLLESHQSNWEVIQLAASDPLDPDAPTVQLHGGWVLQTGTASVVDGVGQAVVQSYTPAGLPAPFTGRPDTSSTTSFGGQGLAEAIVQQTTYAPAIDPVSRALNMRSTVAQSTTTVQPTGAAAVTVRASASTFVTWPSAIGAGVVAPAAEGTFVLSSATDSTFPYSTYAPGAVPSGWLLGRRVTQRTPRGTELESSDGCGTWRSTLYSSDVSFPVARVSNAASGASAYLGFEPYENDSAWDLANVTICSDDAYTGTTSACLPAGAAAELSVAVSLGGTDEPYVIGYWYKTPPGFTPSPGTGCSYSADGSPTLTEFQATNGAWTLQTIGVTTGTANSLQMSLSNAGDVDVLLDSVYVAPLAGGLIATTWETDAQLITGVTDTGGRTRRTTYDSFRRPTVHVGPTGAPQELAMRFLSRQRSGDGTFDPSGPNADVTLHPADGGFLETFLDGGQWATRWAPSDPTAWTASGGALKHTGSGAATLTYQSAVDTTWAVYVEVAPGSQPADLTLSAGDCSVGFADGTFTGWAGATAIGDPSVMAQHWLLVAGDGVTMFFADGQLLYSATGQTAAQPIELSASSDVTLASLCMLASPRLSVGYNDGCGRQRQAQALYGADSLVSDVLYDPMGRNVATTRVVPGSFGSGADLAVLAYRPGVVDVAAFLDAMVSSWQMTGDVADYYQGQADGPIRRSDDQGYPYRGTRWEPSPRQRIVETGLPGLPGAIHDVDTTSPADRVTTQFAYGSNAATSTLPAGMYSQTAQTTPMKTVSSRLTDQLGQGVSSVVLDQSGAIVAQGAGLRTYQTTDAGPQLGLTVQSPNALLPGPQSDQGAYVTATITDAANLAQSTVEPDAGETLFIYDPCGRPRFVCPAQAAGAASFTYTTYDAVGRIVEQGTIGATWDPSSLLPLAAQADWPTADVARTVALSVSYDGDGHDPTAIGQKVAVTTTTPAPTGATVCVATEEFGYDSSGRVIEASMTVAGPSTTTGAVSYTYNNLGELVGLTFPTDAALAQAVYTLDDQGRIAAIGSSPESPSDIAAYTYTADGQVQTETLGDGAWARAMSYTSAGWAQQVATTSRDGQQSFSLGYSYNPDSTVATRSVTYDLGGLSDVLSDSFAYDGQSRLTAATGSVAEAISSYDPNGNVLGVDTAGSSQTFTLAAGCNQLDSATVGGARTDVVHDARGRVTAALGRTFSYDDATNLTIGATSGETSVQFGYGGRHQRLVKSVDDGDATATTTYVTGASTSPVATFDGAQWTSFVYGPTGLVAFYADQAYLPLKDNEHNVWAVVSATGLAARYVYLPFGGVVTADGPTPAITAFTFMAQEWDAELGVYNFRDRLYDPVLRRYLTPDPQRQFPSPYVFCANNPLTVTDPSGDISLWARIGVGIAMGVVLIAGVAASILTAGAAAPEVAAGEAALAGVEAGAGAAAGAAAEGAAAGGAAAAEGGAAGAAEGGVSAAGEVGAGASSGSVGAGASGGSSGAAGAAAAGEGGGAAASSTLASNASYFGIQAGIGAVEGVGTSGMQYDIQNGRTFTAKGFFEAVGWGALSGAVGGALGGIPGMPELTDVMNTLRPLTQFGINVAAQGVAGAVSSDVTQILANVASTGPDKPAWYAGLLTATLVGAGSSAVLGGIGAAWSQFGTDVRSIGTQALDRATTAVDAVQGLARSSNAQMCMGAAAFFVAAGFSVWGAKEVFT